MNYTNITIYAFLFLSAFAAVFPIPAFAANSSIFTIEAWVRPTTSIATKSVVAKAEEMRLVTDASGNPVCQIKHTTWQTATTSSLAISVDTWSHIACSYDKVNLKVFVDGVEKGSTALTVAVDDTAAALKLGTDDSADAVYGEFEGKIDDLRFYNYARTQKQIIQDMSARGGSAVGGNAGSSGSAVAHWKFDEGYGDTVNDSSPQNNDGNLAGSCPGAATCPSWTNSGKFGKALSFDGGDYVDCGAGDSLDITEAITISAWVKEDVREENAKIVVRRATAYPFYFLGVTDGSPYASVSDGSEHTPVTADSVMSLNEWHHLVMSFNDTTDEIILYVDGVSKTVTTTRVYPGDTAKLQIGKAEYANDNAYFNGSIDEVKIYNYALTEDEIRVEYNQGKAIVLGATGTETDGTTPSFSTDREYCVPGDTTSCDPPVAEWNFNEQTGVSAYDTSANNNTGTITNATWTPEGKYGSALSFDGDGDYVNCGSHSSLDITDAITIEAWVKSANLGAPQRIIDKRDTDAGYILYIGSTGKLLMVINEDYEAYSGVLVTHTWYHVVGTYNKSLVSENIKVFVNGIKVGNLNCVETIVTTNNRLAIGVQSPDHGLGYYFNGSIDGVKIYDYARTPAQIAWSYNRGGPVAEWRFDECQGNTAHDESGNGNDGTITIGATVPQTVLGTCETPVDGTGAWYNGATGKINSAMSFDGVDDYVDCGSGSTLNITDAITISAWVKRSGDGTGTFPAIAGITRDYSPANKGVFLCYYPSGNTIRAYLYAVGENWQIAESNSDLPLNVWTHITATDDGIILKLFVNGVEQNTTDSHTGVIDYNGDEKGLIGNYGGSNYFNGLIDEVKIYNYALTAEQVRMDYNAAAVNFK